MLFIYISCLLNFLLRYTDLQVISIGAVFLLRTLVLHPNEQQEDFKVETDIFEDIL